MSRIFVSYHSDVEDFVARVCHCLNRQGGIEPYFDPDRRFAGHFWEHIETALRTYDLMVLFLSSGTGTSAWQRDELRRWTEIHGEGSLERLLPVSLDAAMLPKSLVDGVPKNLRKSLEVYNQRVSCKSAASSSEASACATSVLKHFRLPQASFDDLPSTLSVWYEKDLISEYIRGKGALPSRLVELGYPSNWPDVSQHPEDADASCHYVDNPLDTKQHGGYRTAIVRVDARVGSGGSAFELPSPALTFPEAGPRSKIVDPGGLLRVGVLVSGGIAPGINAVISAIVERHQIYRTALAPRNPVHSVSVYGYLEGFRSLSRSGRERMRPLHLDDVKQWVRRGGSLIPTARADELLTEDPVERSRLLDDIVAKLHADNIDILYVVGGEGSMRAAHAISTVHRKTHPATRLSIVGVPKTMDNDILWVWQSFGFLSAVEQARQSINQLATEAASNPRVCVIQLFGSVSGFVVSHAALGSDVCDLALIPEMEFSMQDVCLYMRDCLRKRSRGTERPFGLVVMAETAIPTDFEHFRDKKYVGLTDDEQEALENFRTKGRRFVGQTPDALRTAALKIVSRVLQRYIHGVMGFGDDAALEKDDVSRAFHGADAYWKDFRVFTNEPRHIIRSMEPSVTDVAYGIRLGTMAVDTAMAGYTDCMVSQWLTEYVVVPLKLVVLGRKRMPREGVFWRTVVSKTGQTQMDALS